jgi:hypothetical protein
MYLNFFVCSKSETEAGKVYKVFIAIFLLFPLSQQAQNISPKGQFLSDSIKVGLPVSYTLAVKYPRQLDIVFPDSTFDFTPFEYEDKIYFPTKTDSLYSYDSVVYTFVTFEIDTIQHMRLPVYIVSGGDSIPVFTSTDSVILQHVVKEIPDTAQAENLPLKESTDYLPLALQFNYPYLIIGIIITVIIVLLVIIIFGKRIKKWWKLRKMKKQYSAFQSKYNKIVHDDQLTAEERATRAITIWKKYMQQLTGYPYTTLTTKEIYNYAHNEQLQSALRQLDKLIYSGKKDEVKESYGELENYTFNQYKKHVEGLKNE